MPIKTPRKIKKQLEALAQFLIKCRLQKELTQAEVAYKLQWANTRYCALENGKSSNGRPASLEAYLNAFNVLNAAGIKVMTGVAGTVKDSIRDYKEGKYTATSEASVRPHSGMGRGRGTA